jgi:hypothetical protein
VKTLLPCDHLGVNGSEISVTGGTVLLESGFKIEYDWLVLALGAESKLDVVPGAMELAFPFYTLEDAIVRFKSVQFVFLLVYEIQKLICNCDFHYVLSVQLFVNPLKYTPF